MHICFKIIKFLLYSTLLYMFRTPLCPSSGAFHHCTCSLWLPIKLQTKCLFTSLVWVYYYIQHVPPSCQNLFLVPFVQSKPCKHIVFSMFVPYWWLLCIFCWLCLMFLFYYVRLCVAGRYFILSW
jgi:hypothetical protein